VVAGRASGPRANVSGRWRSSDRQLESAKVSKNVEICDRSYIARRCLMVAVLEKRRKSKNDAARALFEQALKIDRTKRRPWRVVRLMRLSFETGRIPRLTTTRELVTESSSKARAKRG
jgi:hypothetical protein